ncbi:hypothetical protein ELS19_00320 [Halogeometricum borinquense]|uniref:Uncharacterized protein n=2 Tax=Halogeometricum borinquense TaxID=60847 RepID=A0A482TRC3_9EURY|nr:hypothetical protein ELS19_00320 [Halogeometricum borinquense]
MLARAYVGVEFFVRRRAERGLDLSEADILDRYLRATRRIVDEYLDWPLPDGLPASRHTNDV